MKRKILKINLRVLTVEDSLVDERSLTVVVTPRGFQSGSWSVVLSKQN